MPNENNSVTDFLNESKVDLFQESPVEQVLEEEKEEKAVPFHKDPKVQRYVDKQIEKALKDVRPIENQRNETILSDVKDVIAAFTGIIGNDTPEKIEALKALEKTLNGADERASQKAIERFKEQTELMQRAQSEAEKKAQDELENYFDEIEETYDVDLSSNAPSAKAMRSQFIDYIRKIAPKDEQGEVAAFPDLVAAFEEFQEKGKRAPTRAKELANRGMARSGDTDTSLNTGPKDWKAVERYFDQLKARN